MRHQAALAHIFIYRDRTMERMLPEWWPYKLKAILRNRARWDAAVRISQSQH
jgi:hypothetical protein